MLTGTSLEGSPNGPGGGRGTSPACAFYRTQAEIPKSQVFILQPGGHVLLLACRRWQALQLPTLANTYQLADAVQHQVDALLAHRVVAPGVVVSCILLSRDQLLWMEEVAVGSCPNLIYRERATISLTIWFPEETPPFHENTRQPYLLNSTEVELKTPEYICEAKGISG